MAETKKPVVKVILADGTIMKFEADSTKSFVDSFEELYPQGKVEIDGPAKYPEIPYSCRSGACFVCAAKMEKGEEYLEQEVSGSKIIDTDDDEFLTCIGSVKDNCPQDAEIILKMLN